MAKYLSHSQCETFSQCARKWQLQKIEGAPQAPSEALILGDAVHQAIEHDGRALMEDGKGLDFMALQSIFDQALNDRLIADDPNVLLGLQARAVMQSKGDAILRAYVTHLQPRYAPASVEESFTAEIPGAPGWKFTGRIDARSALADGTPALLDFKTGKAWEPQAEHGKPQATAYLMAESVRPPLAQARAVVFVIFPTESDGKGGYTCKPQFRTTQRTAGQIDAYARYLVATTEQIEQAKHSGEFPAKTGPLCGWCSTLGSCPDGQQWLAEKGRKPAIPLVSVVKEAAQ